MKRIFLTIMSVMSFSFQAKGGNQSSYTFPDGSKLILEYRSENIEFLDKLDFVSDKTAVSLYNEDSLERVLINGKFSDDFYAKSEIVTAVKNNNTIVVVFKLSKGYQNLYPVHTKHYGYVRSVTSKNDFLVKSFVKSNDAWQSYLSFYPQTLFGDTVDQSIKNIEIRDKNNYGIVYDESWNIIGQENDILDTRKKLVKEEGQTVKEIKFDPINRVLFSVSKNGNYYSNNFIWWGSFNKFNHKDDFENHLKDYLQKSKTLKLNQKKYEYFSKANFEEQHNILRKFQENTNKDSEK